MRGKFILYQILLRLYGNLNPSPIPWGTLEENGSGHFCDITSEVLDSLKKLSITHVWYTGVICHATEGDPSVKGKGGSPYAIKDYYDVNGYMAQNPNNRLSEFTSLVERSHIAGLKVIIDFVPNHLSREYNSQINPFDDTNFYPGRICDGDWSDTMKLNYHNRDTWEKMRDILLFWAEKGVDGFRVDMVELVPVEFWEWCVPQIKQVRRDIIFIAEIYQPSNYHPYISRGGFDYLYDKSGFYDHLRAIYSHNLPAYSLTQVWQSLGELQPKMLNFLENHDEQRIASDFFLQDPFKAKAALYVSLLFNTAPFMLYFGQELGERGMDSEGYSGLDGRTTIYDYWSISSVRRFLTGVKEGAPLKYLSSDEAALYDFYTALLNISMMVPSFREGENFDLGYVNPYSDRYDPKYHFSFLRSDGEELYLVVANFSQWDAKIFVNIPKEGYQYLGCSSPQSLQVEVEVKSYDGTILKIEGNSSKVVLK